VHPSRFVVTGLGARCVAHRPWVTAAETCELVLALNAVGLTSPARALFKWVQHLRATGGRYWTGATFPDGRMWPRETTTWTAAAVILAAAALNGNNFFKNASGFVADPLKDSQTPERLQLSKAPEARARL
jgi:hypothetical protein